MPGGVRAHLDAMTTNMNEIVDKSAPVAESKPATVSSAVNVVPETLEQRVAKAKASLLARLAELKIDGLQETALKKDAIKARLAQLEHHVKHIALDGWVNVSAAIRAKLETWLAQP